MKKIILLIISVILFQMISSAQSTGLQIEGKEVFKNDDVVFHQIDEHTWIGTGHLVYNESIYLVEGNKKAVLIDAGTRIKDLDKIVASLTKKPVMLVMQEPGSRTLIRSLLPLLKNRLCWLAPMYMGTIWVPLTISLNYTLIRVTQF